MLLERTSNETVFVTFGDAMIILRWVAFLPAAAVLVAIAQLITGIIAESMAWWISMPLVLFFGVIIFAAAMIPCGMICPTPKIGLTIFLTLFIPLEAIALFGSASEMTWPVLIIRLYTDIAVAFGAIGAATQEDQHAI